MIRKIVAGNWKMNTTVSKGERLAAAIAEQSRDVRDDVLLIVIPPFTHMTKVVAKLGCARVFLGAQNCAAETSGAYTGEVSASMLADIGADYCILGHSERREYYGETDEALNKKLEQCFENRLRPIFCVGEKLADRERNRHFDVVRSQLENTICNVSEKTFDRVIIAYEPVWAIGTGVTADPEEAQEMHEFIRNILVDKFGSVAYNTPLLYGGSCNPANAKALFANRDVDGGLIGGASLKADDFIAIAKSF
jgi:triosephosphate isomerase